MAEPQSFETALRWVLRWVFVPGRFLQGCHVGDTEESNCTGQRNVRTMILCMSSNLWHRLHRQDNELVFLLFYERNLVSHHAYKVGLHVFAHACLSCGAAATSRICRPGCHRRRLSRGVIGIWDRCWKMLNRVDGWDLFSEAMWSYCRYVSWCFIRFSYFFQKLSRTMPRIITQSLV